MKHLLNLKNEKQAECCIQESLKVGILLSAVGGILDAHAYLFREGIFANTQTGNIVILAMALLNGNVSKIVRCLFSIVAFIVGVFLTEILKKVKILNFNLVVLLIEVILLNFLAIFPKGVCTNLVVVLISFICSLQTSSFRSLKGSLYATTMCTGNLRSASFNLAAFVFEKKLEAFLICARYFVIIFSFFSGALIGKILTQIFGQLCLIFCALLLFFALILIFVNLKLKNDV